MVVEDRLGISEVFLLHWAPVASAPGSTAANTAYFTSLALEVPTCTARGPYA
jgi:hypothetical protein